MKCFEAVIAAQVAGMMGAAAANWQASKCIFREWAEEMVEYFEDRDEEFSALLQAADA